MERNEALKIEDSIRSSSFFDHFPATNPLTGMLDFEGEKTSLGFTELLGIQDFTPSIFDMFQVSTPFLEHLAPAQASPVPESSEVLNQPTTPNSSSISSASSGAPPPNDEQSRIVDGEEEQQKAKKQLKSEKTGQKRQKEPRFAFMTKSEVDHLEDGYRWRKYGQKAVKNSPFPRSYYRCTTATCNVKKRLERSFSDPTIVVTTYEGKHTHPSPLMPRPTSAGIPPAGFSADDAAASFARPMQVYCPHDQSQFSNLTPLNCGYLSYINATASVRERRFCTPKSALRTDHGLLQDIVPSLVRNEE